jgi:hypothetical protein
MNSVLERDWFLLKRMLLPHPEIRKTMAVQDVKVEEESGIFSNKTVSSNCLFNRNVQIQFPLWT